MPKKKKNGKKTRKSSGTPTTFEGNYVPASQSGCHVAHHTAPWIIEASDFDPEDYGLECSEEDCVPDMIVDPETKSLRCARNAVSYIGGVMLIALADFSANC